MGEYLLNLAMSMIGQLGITVDDVEQRPVFADEPNGSPDLIYGSQAFWQKHGPAIMALCWKMKPETLGRIAALGRGQNYEGLHPGGDPRTELWQVHGGVGANWLHPYWNGKVLLVQIAATTITAKMLDHLRTAKHMDALRTSMSRNSL